MKKTALITVFMLILSLALGAAAGADEKAALLGAAEQALNRAMEEIGLGQGDPNLLVLTSAGYSQVNGYTTEAMIDAAQNITGCTPGTRSLLTVHKSILDPVWFSVFRKDTGRLVFVKWEKDKFDQQVVDASPNKILTPEGWKTAASGLLGPNAFSVISISLTWAANPPWTLLLAATFHDHFCPGVNAGYIAGQFLKKNLPLGPGDKYVFVTAPGICPADALQVMYNATAGKSSGYSMSINPKDLAKYQKGTAKAFTVAMRVNAGADKCTGLVLAFDWKQAQMDAGVKADEMAPQGGPDNPMFWISRVKMSAAMAPLPLQKQLGYIAVVKEFAGPADLANEVSGGSPYAAAFNY